MTSDESVKLQKAFLDLLVEMKLSLPLLYMESSSSERQNGQLISPQLLNKAFSKIFRIHLLNRHQKPNGTLLSMYKQGMQQLGGTITVLYVHMPRINKNDNIISVTLLVGIFLGGRGGPCSPT